MQKFVTDQRVGNLMQKHLGTVQTLQTQKSLPRKISPQNREQLRDDPTQAAHLRALLRATVLELHTHITPNCVFNWGDPQCRPQQWPQEFPFQEPSTFSFLQLIEILKPLCHLLSGEITQATKNQKLTHNPAFPTKIRHTPQPPLHQVAKVRDSLAAVRAQQDRMACQDVVGSKQLPCPDSCPLPSDPSAHNGHQSSAGPDSLIAQTNPILEAVHSAGDFWNVEVTPELEQMLLPKADAAESLSRDTREARVSMNASILFGRGEVIRPACDQLDSNIGLHELNDGEDLWGGDLTM